MTPNVMEDTSAVSINVNNIVDMIEGKSGI
jgi:hypothetical protein